MAENSSTRTVARHIFWLFILQGISFILLGFLIIFYPAVLFALVAAQFFWIGLTTIIIAFRVRKMRSVQG